MAAAPACRKPRANAREGRDHAGLHVGRAAHHFEMAIAPASTSHRFRRSAFGCFSTLTTRATKTPANPGVSRSTFSTSSPANVRRRRNFRRRRPRADEVAHPTERQLHEGGACAHLALSAGNWPRKRRSFSKNRRMSSTPSLSSAGALDAHAEREALVLVRVVVDRAHHVRMNHSGAEHFGPSGMLADPASGAVAEQALHVELGARLGERESSSRENAPRFRPEKRAREFASARP